MFDRNRVYFQLPLSPSRERARGEGRDGKHLRRYAAWLLFAALTAPLLAHAAPKIQHWTLANGARVYFVEAHELPMVQVRVVFDAGASRDPEGKSGVANLTGTMLREGAAGLSADDIAQRFESLGAQFGAGADRDMAATDLTSLTDKQLLEPALELFAKILTGPSFPEESLKRERERLLVALARDAQSPGSVAQKAFFRGLYGGHPYGRDPIGDEPSLKGIAREDIIAHHKRYYVGANAWVTLVGDVSLTDAKRISERIAGTLPAGTEPAPLPRVHELKSAANQRIAFPASQSHILVGQPGIARNDPDYFPLYVGNYILGGGGLVSRLSEEVREKRGLSYSVYSYFMPMRVPGPFTLGLQTQNAQREQALRIMRQVLEEFVAKGPTDRELEAAKKHITGGFPLRLDSNRKIAEILAAIGFYHLPLTYLDEFIPKVEAVTAQQIRDAFQRRVKPDKMVTVIVGG